MTGPFPLIDAAATVDAHRRRLALTLINRSEHPEQAVISIRDGFIAGPVRLRSLTGTGQAAPVSGVERSGLAEGSAEPAGGALVLELPERSFTLAEAGIRES
jgi:hypothetical protein